jgi:nicotinate phosphoribosyltransferase
MTTPTDLYQVSLSLLTDLYQVTMAYGYWKSHKHMSEAVFHLSFRTNPFEGGFSVACGLSGAIDYIRRYRLAASDVEYLGSLSGSDGELLFERAFLDELARLELSCDIDAVPEGTVVFPSEPLIRVRGPIWQCQLLETPLLNRINFETLIATKAARTCLAARGEPVLEFGLRRAQGVDGGVSASRAAYVGGCAATSNLLAGKLYDIPVRGTHAHSWVMAFGDERDAFEAWAQAMPNNSVMLVDTYDTLAGVRNAIEVGRQLRAAGHELQGIRLDSGDLAYLSGQARRLLDDAGFANTSIIASNDLDENVIQSLKEQGAAIDAWGVGTKLATGGSQSALGGVYKLSALRAPGGEWEYKIKLSEQAIKVSNPGIQQVRRYREGDEFVADVVFDEAAGEFSASNMIDPFDATRRKTLPAASRWTDLLVPVFRSGALVYASPSIHATRERVAEQLASLHAGVKRFVNPHRYPVGLAEDLYERKQELMLAARGLEA